MSEKSGYPHGTFCWVDLMSKDIASAKEFYSAVFGWDAEDQDTQGAGPYVIFGLDGKSVCGMGQMSDEMKAGGMPPVWNSYINTDDVAATCEQATQLGGQVIMPVMQVMEAGSMAAITDPTGAAVMLWQKGYHFGAQLANDPGAFCWNELSTRDLDAAKKFYSELFGWEYETSPGPMGEYTSIKHAGGLNGGMFGMDESFGDVPPHWTVYFNVADLTATLTKAKDAGGKQLMDPIEIPDTGTMSVVTDPQGAAFSVMQLIRWD